MTIIPLLLFSGLTVPSSELLFDHDYLTWSLVLEESVKDGWVDYGSLKESPERLNRFLHQIERVAGWEFDSWTREQRIAFLINVYNAGAMKVIIDHYPRKSIRQIPNVWKRPLIEVFGNKLSLDDIEHGMLRRDFNEPRIHFAVNCASIGCPKLRPEPFLAERLNEQLDEQGREFLADPKKFRFDEAAKTVYLSPIFKWFRKDFDEAGGVIPFVKKFIPKELAGKIPDNARIQWLKYDWSLNDSET